MGEFLDQFVADPEFPDVRWIWWTTKPVLIDFVSECAPFDEEFTDYKVKKGRQYPLEPSCPSCKVQDSVLGVFVFERSSDCEVLQENAWSFLRDHSNEIEVKLLEKLTIIQRQAIELLEEEIADGGPYASHWAKICAEIPDPHVALNRFYKLVGITLAGTGLADHAFVGFEFQTAWDKDHGLEIVMHKDRILAKGGMTELISGYGSVIDGIRATQGYELDTCDYKLD